MTKEQLAQWLVELDENVLQVAIMYAENYLKYGVDITEKWNTATKQKYSLDRAARDGYVEGRKSIVRCKDCKHYKRDTCSAGAGMAVPPPDDWFCADGERK